MSESETTTALAVYGTLAPGEPNHWVVSRIRGEWVTGSIQGYTFGVTWGPADGYLGFLPDSSGSAVSVAVLLSDQLDNKWREVDDFEGPGYERRLLPVLLDDGRTIEAHVYVALTDV